MRIALLARNPNLYSHQRLMEAAKERGHEIQWIDTMKVYLKMGEVRPEMRYKGEEMPQFDAVIPRIGASITFFGTAVLRQFEVMGVYPLNESVAISRSRDKLRSMQLLSRRGVKLPVTGVANGTRQTDDLIHMMGGPPLVIKLVEGTQGVGVVLGDTMPAVKSMINAFAGLEAIFWCRNSSRKPATKTSVAWWLAKKWWPLCAAKGRKVISVPICIGAARPMR